MLAALLIVASLDAVGVLLTCAWIPLVVAVYARVAVIALLFAGVEAVLGGLALYVLNMAVATHADKPHAAGECPVLHQPGSSAPTLGMPDVRDEFPLAADTPLLSQRL